jgi:hypothetical protein
VVSYGVKGTWIYINETNYSISYLPENFWSAFNVAPNDTTVYISLDGGPKDMKVENYVPPINALAVVFDGIKIDTLLSWKLMDINLYEHEKLGRNNFRFTFRFTYENVTPASGF